MTSFDQIEKKGEAQEAIADADQRERIRVHNYHY
jgi:hypothetical protein